MPLENLARVRDRHGAVRDQPLGRQRQVTLFANLLPNGVADGRAWPPSQAAFDELQPRARTTRRALHAAARRELGRAAQNFVLAFVLSLIFMYLILAAQFESWLHPVTILLSLPLTLPFALLSIIIFAAVAEHLLGARAAGAVRRREEELDPADRPREPAARARAWTRDDAVIQASRDRLRPILMTTLRVRRRHDPARRLERHRLGHQPRDRLRHHRRADAGAAAHAARHAGRLLAVRRRSQGAPVAARPGRGSAAAAHRPRRCSRPWLLLAVGSLRRTSPRSQAASRRSAASRAGRRAGRCRSTPGRGRAAGAREQPGSGRRRARARDQRRRGSRGRSAPSCRRCSSASSATTSCSRRRNVLAAPRDAHRRRGRPTSASTSGCPGSARRTPSAGTRRTRPATASSQQLNPLVRVGPAARRLAAAAARLPRSTPRAGNLRSARPTATIADTRLRESRARGRRPREARATGTWSRRAPTSTRSRRSLAARRGTRARQQGQGRRRPVAAARSRRRRRPKSRQRQEQLIVAETTARQAEDRLRMLDLRSGAAAMSGHVQLEPADIGRRSARRARRRGRGHATRSRDRADIVRARKRIENASTARPALDDNQRLPDVRLNASYQAERPRRHPGAARRAASPAPSSARQSTGFGNVLGQLFTQRLPDLDGRRHRSATRSGRAREDANHARAQHRAARRPRRA